MRIFLFILFIILFQFSFSQEWIDVTNEYIINPSFEDYTSCPTSTSGDPDWFVDSVIGWKTPTNGTSDYFNACNNMDSKIVGVPNNGLSYQYPFEGVGYCGFYSYVDWSIISIPPAYPFWTEYIQTKLKAKLIKNKVYNFSFRVNKANESVLLSASKIGGYFSENRPNKGNTQPFIVKPQVMNDTGFLNDTLNWMLIKGEFVADGNEQYLTLGWFGDTLEKDTFLAAPLLHQSDIPYQSYYFIDSLKLYESSININELYISVLTPNGDNFNDEIDFGKFELNQLKFSVFNRWGNLIFTSNLKDCIWKGTDHNGNSLPNGVYYYVLNMWDKDNNQINNNQSITIIN